jgi:hypothetical protein
VARLAFAGVLDGGQIRVGEEFPGNGLYGEWCAEVFVDDDDVPIACRRFMLTP